MEDVSLKSLAPQGSRGLDNAALRAHLTGSARRAAGTPGAAAPFREDEQGVKHCPASPCVHACRVVSRMYAWLLQTGLMQVQHWRDACLCDQLQEQLMTQLQAYREGRAEPEECARPAAGMQSTQNHE